MTGQLIHMSFFSPISSVIRPQDLVVFLEGV